MISFSLQCLRQHLHHCTSIDAPEEGCDNHSIKQCQRKHPNQIAANKICDLAFVLRIFRTLFFLGYLHLHQNIAETTEKQRVRLILIGFFLHYSRHFCVLCIVSHFNSFVYCALIVHVFFVRKTLLDIVCQLYSRHFPMFQKWNITIHYKKTELYFHLPGVKNFRLFSDT